MSQRTYSAKAKDIKREWHLVDVSDQILGRVASQIAFILKGKHKPMYTPHMDTGDHVIVVNAAKVRLTGTKPEKKTYFHHTLYPGGATFTRLSELLEKHPERVVQKAVKGMMPKTKLGDAMMKKLKVYAGPEHPHEAQQPESWSIQA